MNGSFPRTAGVVLLAMMAGQASAAEIAPGDDLPGAVAALKPGDELVLRGGTYSFDRRLRIAVNGTASRPVTIRARDGERAVIRQSSTANNVIEIADSSHLVLRGLEFAGGSQGIRLIDASHITIRQCDIHDTGDVALSANTSGTYEGLVIVRNHIHDTNGTGEGMYLGCNHDACRVANSLIEGNYIHDTDASTVEQGDGIELKEGSYGNVIRHNVIHDTNYPNIITYSTVGNGPPNIIEGNVMWGSGDNALQVAADAIIRNNVILGAPVAFQAHQAGSPSNIRFVHNTVVHTGPAVEVRNVSGPVIIANNAVYSRSGPAIRLISGDLGQVTLAGNVGRGGVAGGSGGYGEGRGVGADFVHGHFLGVPPIDLFPAPGSALIGAGDPAYAAPEDFNGDTRETDAPDAGAYQFRPGGNPGWPIDAGFKLGLEDGVPRPPVIRED